MSGSIYKMIDANINRCMEGLRVCEDIFRFYYLCNEISSGFKKIRHRVKHAIIGIPENLLLSARDVNADDQKFADALSGETRENIHDVFRANIHRAIEASRVIEELSKIIYPEISADFQVIRFSLYDFEKNALSFIMKSGRKERIKGRLYAIIDSEFIKDNNYLKTAEAFIKGGAGVLQLRMKNSSGREYLSCAKKILELCRRENVLFIVNDHPELAFILNSDGLHLGQDDVSISDAGKIIAHDSIIGISTHSLKQALSAVNDSSDYIAAGPVFNTSSKNGENIQGIGVEILKKIKSETDKPVVAIGGINSKNIAEVIESGADSAAVISALYINEKYEENARELSDLIMNTYVK
jgi:thiamine-phosphate pyrophosphorylase